MWWTRFLETDELSILPEDKLSQLNQSAINQLAKMQDQETSLQNQINDISFEICQMLATDDQTQFKKEYSDLPAEEIRINELLSSYNNLEYENESLDEEIMIQETLLYYLNFSKENVSNQHLKTLVKMLSSNACISEDLNERDNCVLCLDLLNYDTKILNMKINQNNNFFLRKSKDLSYQLTELICKSADIVKQIHQLQELVDDTLHKRDLIGPLLPRIKSQLRQDLKSIGNTEKRLVEAKKCYDSLAMERDDLQNECSALSTELMAKPNDGGLSKDEIQTKIGLKQKYLELDIQRNTLRQKNELLTSQLNGIKDSTHESEKETLEVIKQTQILKSAIADTKLKLQMLNEANVDADNFAEIYKASKSVGLEELESALLQKEERLRLMKKRKQNMKMKTEKLIEQEMKFDNQIKRLTELLDTAQNAS